MLSFGRVPVGGQATAVVTLTNGGSEPATVLGTSEPAGPFRPALRMAPGLPVNAGDQVRAPITLAPRQRGRFSASYIFTWSDVTGTHSLPVRITGTGV